MVRSHYIKECNKDKAADLLALNQDDSILAVGVYNLDSVYIYTDF